MDTKISVIAIVISDKSSIESVNTILHGYNEYIIGRLGLPYKQKNVFVISIVLDAEISVINSLSGKLGMVPNVSSKVLTTK